jgi:hypothetical protein
MRLPVAWIANSVVAVQLAKLTLYHLESKCREEN